MSISCSRFEDQLRITADKVQVFDENFSSGVGYQFNHDDTLRQRVHQEPKDQVMSIKINGLAELQKIKNFINHFRKDGTTKIELLFADGKKIILLEKYFLTAYDILDMKNIVGVENVKIS